MHSNSLIGQALGGASGTKASAAQDAAKTHPKTHEKERPFADYVEDADRTKDAAKTKVAPRADQQAANEAVVAQPDGAESATEAAQEALLDGTETELGEVLVSAPDAKKSAAKGTADAIPEDPEALGLTDAAGESELSENVETPAAKEARPDDSGAEDSGAEAVLLERSLKNRPDHAAASSKVPPADPADGTRVAASEKPQATGVSIQNSQSQQQAPSKGAEGVGKDVAAAVASVLEGEETTKAPTAERAVAGSAQVGAAVSEAQKQAALARQKDAGANSNGPRLFEDGEVQRATGDKTSDPRGPAPAAVNAQSTPAVSQSVFQMQVQNLEAGDARKSRYRMREGDLQASLDVPKAPTTAGAGTITATSALMGNASFSLSQSVQAVTAKGSQAASMVGDALNNHSLLSSELPGLPQLLTEAVFQPGATHRVEIPRMVATQLAEAFATKGERKMEVALNPEELGRVKMRVSTNESGIVMTIQTERPETGDLMRRHINELAEEFRRMGFQDISFEFSSGDSSGGYAQDDLGGSGGSSVSGSVAESAATEMTAETEKQNLQLGSSGVDMRV